MANPSTIASDSDNLTAKKYNFFVYLLIKLEAFTYFIGYVPKIFISKPVVVSPRFFFPLEILRHKKIHVCAFKSFRDKSLG